MARKPLSNPKKIRVAENRAKKRTQKLVHEFFDSLITDLNQRKSAKRNKVSGDSLEDTISNHEVQLPGRTSRRKTALSTVLAAGSFFAAPLYAVGASNADMLTYFRNTIVTKYGEQLGSMTLKAKYSNALDEKLGEILRLAKTDKGEALAQVEDLNVPDLPEGQTFRDPVLKDLAKLRGFLRGVGTGTDLSGLVMPGQRGAQQKGAEASASAKLSENFRDNIWQRVEDAALKYLVPAQEMLDLIHTGMYGDSRGAVKNAKENMKITIDYDGVRRFIDFHHTLAETGRLNRNKNMLDMDATLQDYLGKTSKNGENIAPEEVHSVAKYLAGLYLHGEDHAKALAKNRNMITYVLLAVAMKTVINSRGGVGGSGGGITDAPSIPAGGHGVATELRTLVGYTP